MNQPRKILHKRDIIVIGILVLVALLAFFLIRPKEKGNAVAVITLRGDTVMEIDLASAADQYFSLEENDQISFEIKNHQIRFVNAVCPDKICEKNGFLSMANQLSVCLPNQTVLRIVSGQSELDAVVQ